MLAIARALLQKARERYERERQPEVIRDASVFFARITRDRYLRILAPPGEPTLDVLDRNERRMHLDQLSSGTKEQLYFAVRLGLIRELSKHQESLPVVMDDIFANFDPDRALAAMDAVLELARTHQVLVFTCHPETCQLVTNAARSTPLFNLRDGDIV